MTRLALLQCTLRDGVHERRRIDRRVEFTEGDTELASDQRRPVTGYIAPTIPILD